MEPTKMCGKDLHEIRGPQDLYNGGRCKACAQAAQARYRLRRKARNDLVRALEARGVLVDLETMTLTMREPE